MRKLSQPWLSWKQDCRIRLVSIWIGDLYVYTMFLFYSYLFLWWCHHNLDWRESKGFFGLMSSNYSDSLLFCKWKVLSFETLAFHGVIHEIFLCPIPTNLCIQNVRHACLIFYHVYALLDIASRFNGLCYLLFRLLPFPFSCVWVLWSIRIFTNVLQVTT
jgi:hypothetical protein